MAWGSTGGGVWGPGGLGGGSLSGGQIGTHRSPFSGIPSELQSRLGPVLAKEPTWPEPDVTFTHTVEGKRGLTLRRLLRTQWRRIAILTLLIVAETLTLQATPVLTQIGIDEGIIGQQLDVLLTVALLAMVALLATVAASSARIATSGRIAARAMFDLRVRVFAHLQRQSMDFYTREKAGVILTRMTSDVEALQLLLQDGLAQFAVHGLTMVIVTIVLFVYNPQLALITIVLVLPALIALSMWFRRASDRGYARVRDGIAEVLGDLAESLQGVRVVAGFNRQRRNVLDHRRVVGKYRKANDYTANVAGFYGPGTEFIGLLGQAALLVIGAAMIDSGSLSVGELTAFILYLNVFFQPIQQLTQLYNTYQAGKAAVIKLDTLLTTDPSVEEKPDAGKLPPVHGEIVLDHVSFGYLPTKPVLADVDLRIVPGETVALVGPTGAGKSTIAKLIARFHDPTKGRVLLDGHDLRDLSLESLRRQLGVVPQEPFLFTGTIRDNVCFARPDADDDEVWQAVDLVGLTDALRRLPEGLDTPVHERGSSLSAGERQLIALARTFVARPRVVVLDEATSNLDLQSERQVEHALDLLLEGRTAVIVAHRLTTAMRADRVVVVDAGRVLEEGHHLDLLAAGGRYAAMFAAWDRRDVATT